MNARDALNWLKTSKGKGVRAETPEAHKVYWDGYCIEYESREDPHIRMDENDFMEEFRNTTFYTIEA